MPQLVSYVEYKKGTYYADQGDFSTAGSYNIYYRNTIAPAAFFGVGDFGYNQFFTAASHPAGAGNFLYAIEVYHDNGSFVKPDEYNKYSGVFRYSVVHPKTSFTAPQAPTTAISTRAIRFRSGSFTTASSAGSATSILPMAAPQATLHFRRTTPILRTTSTTLRTTTMKRQTPSRAIPHIRRASRTSQVNRAHQATRRIVPRILRRPERHRVRSRLFHMTFNAAINANSSTTVSSSA